MSPRAAAVLALSLAACRGGSEPRLTFYSPKHGLSLEYPASWTGSEASEEGIWYRYFSAPGASASREPAASATLLVGPLEGTLDAYAARYLEGNDVILSADEMRQGLRGRHFEYAAPDERTRYSLLLLRDGARVVGLYAQGSASGFPAHAAELAAIADSLRLERPEEWRAVQGDGFTLRLPPSWHESRHFAGSGTLLLQFTSPALAADRDRRTVHASLTLTAEPADGDVDAFYAAAREKLGASFRRVGHGAWGDGYVDVLTAETSVSESRSKRFYRVADGRGYTLAFEARDDAYPLVAGWADAIAGTFQPASAAAKRP